MAFIQNFSLCNAIVPVKFFLRHVWMLGMAQNKCRIIISRLINLTIFDVQHKKCDALKELSILIPALAITNHFSKFLRKSFEFSGIPQIEIINYQTNMIEDTKETTKHHVENDRQHNVIKKTKSQKQNILKHFQDQ